MPRQIDVPSDTQNIIKNKTREFNDRLRKLSRLVPRFDNSIAEMARCLYISPSKMNTILNHTGSLKLSEVMILIHVYNVREEWLYHGKGEPLSQAAIPTPEELKEIIISKLNNMSPDEMIEKLSGLLPVQA